MKLNPNKLYEVYNTYTEESVFCDFKPTNDDVVEIAKRVDWQRYVQRIEVGKMKLFFTKDK